MEISGCPIYTIIRGQAHSMGAIIAAFGDNGCRYSTPNSTIMLHSGIAQIPPGPVNHQANLIAYAEKEYDEKIGNLARRLNIGKKKLIKLLDETKWMTPCEAISLGLVDGIWTANLEQMVNKG